MSITTKVASGVLILSAAAAMTLACGTDAGPKPIGSGGGSGGEGNLQSGNGAGGGSPGGGAGPGVGGRSSTGGAVGVLENPFFNGQGNWVQGTAEGGAGGAGGDGSLGQDGGGIQGAFYILEDSVKDEAPLNDGLMHSDFDADTGTNKDVEPSQFDEGTVKPCITGTTALAKDGKFDLYWGGGIGLNLNETGGESSVKKPFNAEAAAINGFEFILSGDTGAAEVRLKASVQDDPSTTDVNEEIETNYCVSIRAKLGKGVIRVGLEELVEHCWASGGAPVDPTRLMALQWLVVTHDKVAHTVKNFCIESVGTY
jgi:hypothetical protein